VRCVALSLDLHHTLAAAIHLHLTHIIFSTMPAEAALFCAPPLFLDEAEAVGDLLHHARFLRPRTLWADDGEREELWVGALVSIDNFVPVFASVFVLLY
jgi:hypothetical protein